MPKRDSPINLVLGWWRGRHAHYPPRPEAIDSAVPKLTEAGFRVVAERYDEASFGNYALLLRKQDLCVQFVRDRSQWFAEIGMEDCREWFSSAVWCDYLDRSYGSPEFALDEACRYIVANVDRMIAAVGDPGAAAQLFDMRHRRATARWAQMNAIQDSR